MQHGSRIEDVFVVLHALVNEERESGVILGHLQEWQRVQLDGPSKALTVESESDQRQKQGNPGQNTFAFRFFLTRGARSLVLLSSSTVIMVGQPQRGYQ